MPASPRALALGGAAGKRCGRLLLPRGEDSHLAPRRVDRIEEDGDDDGRPGGGG